MKSTGFCGRATAAVDRLVVEQPCASKSTTVEEVATILRKMAVKQCQIDQVPTWLMDDMCEIVVPNSRAIVRPLSKKQLLDSEL